jgi:hypothetical protein
MLWQDCAAKIARGPASATSAQEPLIEGQRPRTPVIQASFPLTTYPKDFGANARERPIKAFGGAKGPRTFLRTSSLPPENKVSVALGYNCSSRHGASAAIGIAEYLFKGHRIWSRLFSSQPARLCQLSDRLRQRPRPQRRNRADRSSEYAA